MRKTAINSQSQREQFIRKRKQLFWYIKDDAKVHISDEFLVETILNYGLLEDVKKLFDVIGLSQTAKIFRKRTRQARCNYLPKVKNYFTLYFRRHA
ncbi:MAG: hypothetical protein V1799_19570 [bacterium]